MESCLKASVDLKSRRADLTGCGLVPLMVDIEGGLSTPLAKFCGRTSGSESCHRGNTALMMLRKEVLDGCNYGIGFWSGWEIQVVTLISLILSFDELS